ncbi:MAG: polysaccharide biosynthesis tyrosine autokinase [Spartobacteria bacterium]|nr:polysaccharide biosynthesis tyrosine autokinase [Spartobacteria bacterium]
MAREELVFSDYLRVVLRHKWYVFSAVILTFTLTYLISGREVPVYQSRTRIKVQRVMTFADMFDEVLMSSGNPIENYLYEISSYVVISSAATHISYPEPATPEAIAALHGSIRAQSISGTDLIDIFSKAPTPAEARARGEAVVSSFIKHHDEMMRSNAEEIYNSIKESRDNLLQRLVERDAEIWNKMGARAITGAQDASEMGMLKAKLTELELQLWQLRSTGNYTEEYPEIQAIKKQIEVIKDRITSNVEQEYERHIQLTEFEQQKTISDEMSLFFTRKLEEAKIASQRKSEVIHVIEPTNPGTPISRGKTRTLFAGLLLGLILGIVIAFIADSLDTSIRTLVEIEETFQLSVLGVIPHFSPDDIDVPLHTDRLSERVRYSRLVMGLSAFWRALALSFRSSRRRNLGSARRAELVVPFAPRSPATEGYRILRTNMRLVMEKTDSKIFLVTSSGPAEGKSTTITNLAITFAQAGSRVLLIGANMRRPKMHRIFGLERDQGLSNILAGEVEWRSVVKDYRDVALGGTAPDELITAPGIDNLFFITSGGKTVQPAEWLSLPAFNTLLDEVRGEYDIVLIDGTPVLPVPDSVIIAQSVDQVLLVYMVGVASRESIRRASNSLRNVGGKIAGLILNDVRSSWAEGADFRHYRGYYGRPDHT